MLGALRKPNRLGLAPADVAPLLVKARFAWWQSAHDWPAGSDSDLSWKISLPSAIFASRVGLEASSPRRMAIASGLITRCERASARAAARAARSSPGDWGTAAKAAKASDSAEPS